MLGSEAIQRLFALLKDSKRCTFNLDLSDQYLHQLWATPPSLQTPASLENLFADCEKAYAANLQDLQNLCREQTSEGHHRAACKRSLEQAASQLVHVVLHLGISKAQNSHITAATVLLQF